MATSRALPYAPLMSAGLYAAVRLTYCHLQNIAICGTDEGLAQLGDAKSFSSGTSIQLVILCCKASLGQGQDIESMWGQLHAGCLAGVPSMHC